MAHNLDYAEKNRIVIFKYLGKMNSEKFKLYERLKFSCLSDQESQSCNLCKYVWKSLFELNVTHGEFNKVHIR